MSDSKEMVAVRISSDERYPVLYVSKPHSGWEPDVEIPAALFEEFHRTRSAHEDSEAMVAEWILSNVPDLRRRVKDDCVDFAGSGGDHGRA